MEEYKTIKGVSTATIIEKKSEFISCAAFVDTEEKALAFLQEIRKKHHNAAHNVFAYVLKDGARVRCSDDGEPAKTSGPPTLEVIQHAEIVNCIIVTTRYFGGTLLGTGGLVRAYTQAAKAALDNAEIVEINVCISANLNIPYHLYEQATRLLTQGGAKQETAQFAENVTIPFVILPNQKDEILTQLQTLCKGVPDIEFSQPFHAPF